MNKFYKTVLLTGLFVGTNDILYAFISIYIRSGKFSEKMFTYIAAGALGIKTAMAGGVPAALLGMFFHYFISFAYTLFFFCIFPKVKFLSFNKYLIAMLYAVFVNLTMNQLIMRLTTFPPPGPFNVSETFIDCIIFGIVFCIPVTWNTYKYYGVKEE